MNATFLAALAEPHRLEIIELLARRPYSVNDLAAALQMRQPQASKHLRALHEAQLVRVRREAQRHIYSLDTARLEQLKEWVEALEYTWIERSDKLRKR